MCACHVPLQLQLSGKDDELFLNALTLHADKVLRGVVPPKRAVVSEVNFLRSLRLANVAAKMFRLHMLVQFLITVIPSLAKGARRMAIKAFTWNTPSEMDLKLCRCVATNL